MKRLSIIYKSKTFYNDDESLTEAELLAKINNCLIGETNYISLYNTTETIVLTTHVLKRSVIVFENNNI